MELEFLAPCQIVLIGRARPGIPLHPARVAHDNDDGGGVDEPFDRGYEERSQTLRIAVGQGEGAGHRDGAAVFFYPRVLAAGDDPGGHDCQDHHGIDQDQGMREADFSGPHQRTAFLFLRSNRSPATSTCMIIPRRPMTLDGMMATDAWEAS